MDLGRITWGRAARRLEQMRDLYAYLFAELPALIDRWKEQRDA